MEREKLISLVTAAQNGDNGALNELFSAFYNDVYYFALKTLKDDEIACDVTQEAFVEIIRTIGNLQEPAAFVKWMKQITYHQCTRYFKKKKDVIVDEDEDGNTLFDTVQEDKTDFIPDEALDQDEFKKTILAMLDDLSEEQRAAVLMFYYDEMSVKQIAEIQGVSENTVKSRLNYARKGIKKSVEDYEEKHGVKLHGLTALPLLRWVLGDLSHSAPAASAGLVAEGVSAATGVTLAVTATTASTAATAATVGAAVGIGAKIAAIPLAAKVAAGVAAAIIAIGGGTAAVILSNGGEDAPTAQTQVDTQPSAHIHKHVEEVQQAASCTEDGSAVYTCSCGDTYTAVLPAAHTWGEWHVVGLQESHRCTACGCYEYREALHLTLEQVLDAYTSNIPSLAYFDSVDQLDALNVLGWCWLGGVEPIETVEEGALLRRTYAVSDLDAYTTKTLGRTWDYFEVDGQSLWGVFNYTYDAAANTVIEECHAGMGIGVGSGQYRGYQQMDDTHFAVTYLVEYQGEVRSTDNVMVVELVNGQYIIVANYAAEDVPSDVTDATTAPTTTSTTNPTGTSTTNPTGSTTGSTTTTTTTPTTTVTTTPGHTHNYVAKTTPATCTADGKKVYTCSCGSSYTEVLTATGHRFGAWSQTKAPTATAQGQKERRCANCSTKETAVIDPAASHASFEQYATALFGMDFFSNTNELTAAQVLQWTMTQLEGDKVYENGVDPTVTYTYRVADLDAFTLDWFGRTWEYASFSTAPDWPGLRDIVYDATAKTVSLVLAGSGTFEDIFIDYTGFQQRGEGVYEIYGDVIKEWETVFYSVVITVKRVDDNFVVTSYKEV